jgi:uncharacterized short protein YbdD (DUF466 family)
MRFARVTTATPRRAASRLWWYLPELTGENAYDRYAERFRRDNPTAQVPSRGEFERSRVEARSADPRNDFHCC